MIKWLVEYRNSRGRIVVKGFSDDATAFAFMDKLDKRIEKGTCGGYTATTLF